MNKIYFIVDFTYDVQFLFDLDNKRKYCGFSSKRKLHRKRQTTKFFYISNFNLVHLITMHYYMHFGEDNMNLYINFLTLLKCG